MGVPRDKVFDVPAYMIADELMIDASEASHKDASKPTQDLIAADQAEQAKIDSAEIIERMRTRDGVAG